MRLPSRTAAARFLAAAILALVLGLVYMLLVAPYREALAHLDEERLSLAERLARVERLNSTADARQEALAAARAKALASQPNYLNGATEALAGAWLQDHLKGIVETAGGQLTSTQILPDAKTDEFSKVTVQVEMQAAIGALREIYHHLEGEIPRLFVADASLRTTGTIGLEQPRFPGEILLTARFNVYGFQAPTAPEKPAEGMFATDAAPFPAAASPGAPDARPEPSLPQ
jgi:general secretion pathway protein M